MNSLPRLKATLIFVVITLILATAIGVAADGPKWIGAFFVKGKVGLKWQTFEGATEYRVYRQMGSSPFENILTTDKTQHFDTGITPGEVHKYKIAAIDASGSEIFSTEKLVTVPGGTGAGFKPPEWVGLRTDRRGILLAWDRVKGAVAYNIHRSSTAGGPYEVVGNTPSTKYSDRDIEQGGTYYYVLNAMSDEFEETELSEEREMKFGMTSEELAAADTTSIELIETKLTFLFSIDEAGSGETLNQPFDVFLNSKGDIYVSDTRRFRINCYDPSGKHKFSFGERTPKDQQDNPPEGTFESPMSIFIDQQDRVYVGDTENHDIQVFSADGKFLQRIRVAGKGEKQPFRPNGVCVLDDGRIVTTDAGSHRLLILDQQGQVLFETGHGGTTQEEQDGLWFSFPLQVVSSNGVLSVIDQMGARVQQFDLNGKFIRVFGQAGYSAGQFGRPKGLATDEAGRIWVSDGMANTIQIFSPDGEVKSAITGFDDPDLVLTSPGGMFVRDGKFYLVTRLTCRVLVFQIG
jgi:sugar lactone lactonase YvrE/fibronectin type 3 domain-containing protein